MIKIVLLIPLVSAFIVLFLLAGALGQAPEMRTPALVGGVALALVACGGLILAVLGSDM